MTVTPLMTVGVLLMVMAIAVLLTASLVAGVDPGWAAPLFLGGVLLAIVGAVVRR